MGLDFLTSFGLTVDLHRPQLLDNSTTLSINGKASSINSIGIRLALPDNRYTAPLRQFPEILQPASKTTSLLIESISLILLGIRNTVKGDIGCTPAQLVYGQTLRVPGNMVCVSTPNEDLSPSAYVSRLQDHMRQYLCGLVKIRPPLCVIALSDGPSKKSSAVASFWCLAAMQPEGSSRARTLPGRPSLDRGSREAEVAFEPDPCPCAKLLMKHCLCEVT
ncbi:hypothetical protein CSKR_114399 [Clonorchis sinensis]|uniref:Uncharacterized protein n=1 Tax=Clonorchis sinensis TaxID=79923 RepID=A0A3R7CGB3_CLOSI|nr:hypothetical protein CSKR_114399 [Clonorchis sinensis]